MTDTHCHLDFPKFDEDRSQVIEKTLQELDFIINVGAGLKASERAIELAERYEKIYASVGIHPQDTDHADRVADCADRNFDSANEVADVADNIWEVPHSSSVERLKEQVKELEELIQSSTKIVAIGETGLDYSLYQNKFGTGQAPSQYENQKTLFRLQIRLAQKYNLPLIIHSRDAIEDTLRILKEENAPQAVFHCFTYDKTWAKKVLNAGYLISFTGIVTFPNAQIVQETAKHVPLSKMMVETDAPFLAPIPYRGQRCEPWMVQFTAAKIAKIKGVLVGEVEKETDKNAKRFFGIGMK